MAQSVSGGGMQGKDLSKADVSVNIYAFLKAQKTGKKVELFCAIGDETIDGKPYREIVEIARNYIQSLLVTTLTELADLNVLPSGDCSK